MRPFTLCNATKVLITVFALILSLTGFSEARDQGGDRHKIRRPHHERQIRDRSESYSSMNAGRRDNRYERRDGRNRIVGRTEHRRHGERRFARDDRRIDVREYREDNRKQRYRGDGFPSHGNGGTYLGGTYFGGLSAWRERGNGIYFRSERYGNDYSDRRDDYRGAGARIIRVDPNQPGRSCSWESGVCVIRR